MANDSVAGLVVERTGGGGSVAIPASAVVLASGGFEWNPTLRTRFLAGPLTHPHSPPVNDGDGLLMAMAVGSRPRQSHRDVVVSGVAHPRRGVRPPSARPLRRHRAHRAALDHREPFRRAVRQRGGQLQRHDEGLLLVRRQRVLAAPPALLGGLRSPVPVALRRGHLPARRSRSPVALRARHGGRPRQGQRDRPRRAARLGRALEPSGTGRVRSRLRPRLLRLRPVPRGSLRAPPQPRHDRGRTVLRPAHLRRLGRHQGRTTGRRRRPDPARAGPSRPRSVRRGQRDRQPRGPRLLRRWHLDRDGHRLGSPGRNARRGVRDLRRPGGHRDRHGTGSAARRGPGAHVRTDGAHPRLRRTHPARPRAAASSPAPTGRRRDKRPSLRRSARCSGWRTSWSRPIGDCTTRSRRACRSDRWSPRSSPARPGSTRGRAGRCTSRTRPAGLVLSTGIVGSGLPIATGVGMAASAEGFRARGRRQLRRRGDRHRFLPRGGQPGRPLAPAGRAPLPEQPLRRDDPDRRGPAGRSGRGPGRRATGSAR